MIDQYELIYEGRDLLTFLARSETPLLSPLIFDPNALLCL
jgi:dynein heavy chain, axonemal